MPTEDVTPEAEARWQGWLAKGRAREMRTRRSARTCLLLLVFGSAVVAAFALNLG